MDGLVIEVLVMWDGYPLSVAHLTGDRGFWFGEAVVVTPGGALVVLPNATGFFESPGKPRRSLADLAGSELVLARGVTRMELPTGVAFQVTVSDVEKAPFASALAAFESEAHRFHALSFLLHAGVLGSLALFMPALRADDSETIDRERILLMQHILESADSQSRMSETTDNAGSIEADGTSSAPGAPLMGNPDVRKTSSRYAVAGPQDNPDPHLARLAVLREAAEFGMVSLLGANAGDPNAPVVAWGRDLSLGNDETSARGNMWGDAIGDSLGVGGIGLTGIGECGCGTGVGIASIGLDSIGTIGHIGGGGVGFSGGSHDFAGTHRTRAPVLRCASSSSDACATTVNGRLPPEIVQRVVRQNFGRFRRCYEDGLHGNPSLEGRVAVKFVIARDGSVMTSQDGGSDLADDGVRQCVVRSFGTLSFPKPEGGIVTVVYPIVLSPS